MIEFIKEKLRERECRGAGVTPKAAQAWRHAQALARAEAMRDWFLFGNQYERLHWGETVNRYAAAMSELTGFKVVPDGHGGVLVETVTADELHHLSS